VQFVLHHFIIFQCVCDNINIVPEVTNRIKKCKLLDLHIENKWNPMRLQELPSGMELRDVYGKCTQLPNETVRILTNCKTSHLLSE